MKCENAHETPCKTLQEQRCLHLCSYFVCPLKIWSSSFNPMCSKYSYLPHVLTRIFKLSAPPGSNVILLVTVGSLEHHLHARISRLIEICDIISHRRLIAIKKQKRRLNHIIVWHLSWRDLQHCVCHTPGAVFPSSIARLLRKQEGTNSTNTERYVFGKLTARCFQQRRPFSKSAPFQLWKYRAWQKQPRECV